jgi:hypothetical protein
MLLNINNKIFDINENLVLYNLYYNLAILPDKNTLKSKKIKNITEFIVELKKKISKLDNFIPLYDLYSKNIYLVKPNEVYDKVINSYYRPLNIILYKYLESIKTNDKKLLEKIHKNLKFMDNFDLHILEETYIKTFYYQSNKIGKNFTLCIKPSFLPFININPYYNRDELINMGLNMKLIKEDDTIYDIVKIDKLCQLVSNYDIDSDTLLNHYLFIQENNIKYYIKYFSFMGSYQMNYYLRNKSIKDSVIEKNINQFYNIIKKAPLFNDAYYLYRFILNDDYLGNLKIGNIFTDNSFMSTSRNPFYNPVNNVFGNILLKIKIPKNIEGVGICMENYSLFPEEQEIILNPCRLKLVSRDDNIVYYHTDKKAQKSIKRKYEFEWVDSVELEMDKITKHYNSPLEIPIIDIYNYIVFGSDSDIKEKLDNFTKTLPLINTSKRFFVEINNKKLLFNVNTMSDKRIYEKFFYLQKRNYDLDDIIDELYITYQDEQTCEILLMIEIKNVISVNYLQKFTGCNKEFNDKDLIFLIGGLSRMFGIYEVIIHPNFKPFSTILTIKPNEYKNVINNITDYHDIQRLSNDIILYNNDLLTYLISKKDRFDNIYIKTNYKKFIIDKLNSIKVEDIFNEENYEIYSIIKKEKFKNMTELILYFFKNYFYLLDKVIYSINLYFDDKIVINKLYYIFDVAGYLYEKGLINYTTIKFSDALEAYINKLDVYNISKKELR